MPLLDQVSQEKKLIARYSAAPPHHTKCSIEAECTANKRLVGNHWEINTIGLNSLDKEQLQKLTS
jgi:hypothetical protein